MIRRDFLRTLFAAIAAWFGFRAAKARNADAISRDLARDTIRHRTYGPPKPFTPADIPGISSWLRPADDGSGMIQSCYRDGVEVSRIFVPVGGKFPNSNGLVVARRGSNVVLSLKSPTAAGELQGRISDTAGSRYTPGGI